MPRKVEKETTKGIRKKTSVGQKVPDDENYCPTNNKKPKLSKETEKNNLKENPVVLRYSRVKVKNPHYHVLNYYRSYELGVPCQKYKRPLKDVIINYIKNFKVCKVESPFDRRVTFIIWHPTIRNVLSVTSHGGDVILYNYEEGMSSACLIQGIGAGGSVQGMKFDPHNPVQVYTASMEGKFLVLNFHTKQAKQFLETYDINRWYVSVDVNSENNLMVAGDTKGGLTILTIQGEIVDTVQVHRKNFKVSHAEFSKREPSLLCTSSTDGTLKLWDIRNLKSDGLGMAKPLQVIEHDKPINAAYFSLTDGCRLLTTDQYDRMFVYKAPLWKLETSIHHPHRQFQHLTPIKAYWHPLEDIVFVGRYPHERFPGYHENELRTIDFFDAETGDLLYQHYQIGIDGILSLNRFNVTGDALASSYGYRFLIWRPNFKFLEKYSKRQDLLDRNKNSILPDDDDDDDFDDDIDWGGVFKKKTKEKKVTKEKLADKTK